MMIKKLIGKLKKLRLYFVSGGRGSIERKGLKRFLHKKYGYGITWGDE